LYQQLNLINVQRKRNRPAIKKDEEMISGLHLSWAGQLFLKKSMGLKDQVTT